MNEIINQHTPIVWHINGTTHNGRPKFDMNSISQTIKYPNGGCDLYGKLKIENCSAELKNFPPLDFHKWQQTNFT